jgi:hypothetical protein
MQVETVMFEEAAKPEVHFHALSAVLGLAPTLLGTGAKWLQENSKSKRRSQLAERLGGMSKLYSEQPSATDEVLLAARGAMGAEIAAICAELTQIQADSQRTSRRTIYGWLSDTLLLFRPHGFLAWVVHFVFYVGTATVALGLVGVAIESKANETTYALAGFFFIGLGLLGLQRLAIWLRKQTQTRTGVFALAH